MPLPTISTINFTTALDDREVQATIRAVNRQIREDFASVWGAVWELRLHASEFDPDDPETLAEEPIRGEGVLYHFITTNYDYTIETILDNIDDQKAPIVNRVYRGVSPEVICGEPSWNRPAHTFDHNLIKLNGGFEILDVRDRYHFEYRRRDAADVQERPPILILPSREQDYTDPYFRTIFSKAVRVLRDTQVLVIVGYSMPREDALLLFILRQLAESAEDAHGKHIFCIDLNEPDLLNRRLNWTFNYAQKFEWPKVFHYTGRFENFCKEVVDQ